MAGSVNKVTILGNLARDPEVRQTPDGQKIVTLSVATSEQWRDKNTGERREKAEFHRVVLFNERLADVAEKYLKKGNKAYFEGQLQTRKWTDQSGQDRYTTEIVLPRYRGELMLLDRKSDGPSGGGYQTDASYGTGSSSQPSNDVSESLPSTGTKNSAAASGHLKEDLNDFDDEIPF